MTAPQKAAFTLLISVIAMAVFSVLAFTGLFDLIEARFYNPSVARSQIAVAGRDAEAIRAFLEGLERDFAETLNNDAVRRSFLPSQDGQDIFERTQIYGLLSESQKGLQSVRFVDAGGVRIHFSTNPADILNQDTNRVAYRNYPETAPFAPFGVLAVPEQGNPKITFDSVNERVVLSFPFYDSFEVYRGSALFSVSSRALTDMLVVAGRLRAGEDISLVSQPGGVVLGVPGPGKQAVVPVVASAWQEGIVGLSSLSSNNSGSSLILVSAKTEPGFFVGRIVEAKLFAFPAVMKLILLVSFFLTVYLTIFLCFSFRADTMTVIRNRIKNLELSLIREYYERKGEMDWNRWRRELENRREDVRTELKRGVRTKNGQAGDVDILINKSWDEILNAIGGPVIDEDKLQGILNRLVRAASDSARPPRIIDGGILEELEEAEPAELTDDNEELEELTEPADNDVLEELEELTELTDDGLAEFGEETADGVEELEEAAELTEPADNGVLEELEAEPAELTELTNDDGFAEFGEGPADGSGVLEELEAEPAEFVELTDNNGIVEFGEETSAELTDDNGIVEFGEGPADGSGALEELEAEPAELTDNDVVEFGEETSAELTDNGIVEFDEEAWTDPGTFEADVVLEGPEIAIEIPETEEAEILEEPGERNASIVDEIAAAEADLAAHPRRKSNIQLVFGGDDIPYIVESSGLELVDELSAVDGVDGVDGVEEPEELEALEELETGEVMELDMGDESESAEAPRSGANGNSHYEDIASRIEFSGAEDEGEDFEGELEVVSPFATVLSHINFGNDEPEMPEELYADAPLFYPPFHYENRSLELLDSDAAIEEAIIEENGLSYVNETARSPDGETEKKLDPGLKTLVDSVIQKSAD